MAASKILFIEGEPNSPNGDLRQGFTKLLEKIIRGRLPRIILGGGKNQTIDKFINPQQYTTNTYFLLVDLDNAEDGIEQDIRDHNLQALKEHVFYMIQEMESWFLSQPDLLDTYFGLDSQKKKVSQKIPQRPATEIPNPKSELKLATKDSKKGKYQEIRHGAELLKQLDAEKLKETFPDFKRLIDHLIKS